METQNITLALPKDLLREAKIVAAERGTSVSAMLRLALAEIVAGEERYTKAKQHHLALLERGVDLGTGGTIRWQRDELYER